MQLPTMLQGKRKDRGQEGQMLEGGSENLHMRKAIDHYQPLSSPPLGSSGCFLETQQGQVLAPLSCRAGRWDSSGQGSHTLAPIRATLGSAPAKGSGASPRRRQARARPGPLRGRVPPPRLAGQQQARMTATLDGREEGTSKRSALGPTGAAAQALARWSGPGGLGEGRAQSSTFNDVPDTDGKAGPGKKPAPPAVQQADGENLP